LRAQNRITLHELEQGLMQPGRKELKDSENRWRAVTAAIITESLEAEIREEQCPGFHASLMYVAVPAWGTSGWSTKLAAL
jgi:hypothetical protein